MLFDVVMPQMGESLAEGTIVRWAKQAGDRVERDEPLFEITTDKVDTDVPSPASGILRAILAVEGQTVDIGARVAVIDDGEPSARVDAEARPPVEKRAARPSEAVVAGEAPAGHFKSAHAPQLVSFRRDNPGAAAAPPAARTFTPAVLGLARDAGLSLATVTAMQGSGRGGRVTKADVARFVESRGTAAIDSRSGAPSPSLPGATAAGVPPQYLYRLAPEDTVVPMSPIRRKTAEHMSWSARISPHATAFAECDMTAAVDGIRRERDAFSSREGVPLTVTVAVALAFAHTLREFRTFNASVIEDAVVLKPHVHLGIAVALPDTDDLIVPVVRHADELSLSGMARAIADLAARARTHRLRVEDVQGGTVTLTNPGMFGGLTGTPILHQPQVAILGVGAIVRRPVVLDDDSIVPRAMTTLSLTFDHRAADGMAAFKLLARLKGRLEAGLVSG